MKLLWLAPAALLLVGCAPKPVSFAGSWVGTITVPPAAADADEKTKTDLEAARILAANAEVPLEIKADGTYSTQRFLIMPVEGTWKAQGNSITFTPTKVLGAEPTLFEKGPGKAAAQVKTLELAPDGTLTLKESDGTATVFRRQ